MSSFDLNMTIPVNSLGYGMHALSYYKMLREDRNARINLRPINALDDGTITRMCESLELDEEKMREDLARKDLDASNLIVWHANQVEAHKMKGVRNCLLTAFETSELSNEEVAGMNSCDIAGTYSAWGQQMMTQHGVHCPIIVSGPFLSSMIKEFPQTNYLRQLGEDRATLALSMGKWEERKRQKRLIEIVQKTDLTRNDRTPFTVVAMWSNPFCGGLKEPMEYLQANSWRLDGCFEYYDSKIYCYSFGEHTILLLDHLTNYKHVLATMNECDVAFSLSCGEGWDMPLTDAIGLGIAVVGTENTAHSAYSGYFFDAIPCEAQKAYDGRWFHGKGLWYPPSPEFDQIMIENTAYLSGSRSRDSGKANLSRPHQKSSIVQKLKEFCNV